MWKTTKNHSASFLHLVGRQWHLPCLSSNLERFPKQSMYGMFTYMFHQNQLTAGWYTILMNGIVSWHSILIAVGTELGGCHPGISKVTRLSRVAALEILEIIIQMLVVGGDGGKSCYPKDVQQLLHSTVNKHSQLVQSTLCRCLEKVVDLHCFFLFGS